jgi:hypothetical protein
MLFIRLLSVGRSNGISILDSVAESLHLCPFVNTRLKTVRCGNVSCIEETILRTTHTSLCSVQLFFKGMVQWQTCECGNEPSVSVNGSEFLD